jgi:hypothetical protein
LIVGRRIRRNKVDSSGSSTYQSLTPDSRHSASTPNRGALAGSLASFEIPTLTGEIVFDNNVAATAIHPQSRQSESRELYTADSVSSTPIGNSAPFSGEGVEILQNFKFLENAKREFESIIEAAKALSVEAPLGESRPRLIENFNTKVKNCISTTRTAIKAAKSTLNRDNWIPNRGIIHQSLRRLQMSAQAMDEVFNSTGDKNSPDEDYSVYPLGIVCGGEVSDLMTLFSLPNEGNIPFPFTIVPNSNDSTAPNNVNAVDVFNLHPKSGFIQPNETLDIQCSFSGIQTGNYRQGFIFKSLEDVIAMFAVSGIIGNPIIKLIPENIDYGLISVGSSQSITVNVKNVGSYEGHWEFSMNKDQSALIKPNPVSGKTESVSNSKISIALKARNPGKFAETIELIWKYGTIPLKIQAEGGESKLEVQYPDSLSGVDFGTVLVGLNVEKVIKIKNCGNMDAKLSTLHPNASISVFYENNDCLILPGAFKEVKIVYTPKKVENLKEILILSFSNSRVGFQNIPLNGSGEIQQWEVEGLLDFKNIPLSEYQEKVIRLKNTGTASIEYEMKWIPSSYEELFEVEFEGKAPGISMDGGEITDIKITFVSSSLMSLDGEIIFSSKIVETADTKTFPFKFKVYAEEVEAEITHDIDLGRKALGSVSEATQVVINNGNRKIRYRATIENDEVGVWELLDNSEGFLCII